MGWDAVPSSLPTAVRTFPLQLLYRIALAALDPQVEEEKGNCHGLPCLVLAECQSDLTPEKARLEACFLLCFLKLFQMQ